MAAGLRADGGAMKGYALFAPGDIRFTEWPVPEIGDDEILVKVAAVGICGSDVHAYNGHQPSMVYPCIIGHEISGEVAQLGRTAAGITVGNHVILDPVIKCGECPTCLSGKPNICFNLQVLGVHVNGGLAEYVKVKAYQAHVISKGMPLWKCAFAEPLSIGGQAVARGKVRKGDRLLIIGAGPIGLSVLIMAKAKGAYVAVADINAIRLGKAEGYGADKTINSLEVNLEEAAKSITGPVGFDIVIDAVGSQAVLDEAVKCVGRGGRLVILGLAPNGVGVSALTILKKELDVIGSRMSHGQFAAISEMLSSGLVDPASAITHRFPFGEVEKAFELALKPDASVVKIVVEMPS